MVRYNIKRIDRLGEVNYNKHGSKMTIIEYTGCHNMVVEFDNGYKTHTYYHVFKKGETKNPYDRITQGVGYIGEGDFVTSIKRINTTEYDSWTRILERGNSSKFKEKQPTYKNCTVCEEWLNFQSFAKWHKENFYQLEDFRMELDKDILIKGNIVYSPEACCFVPQFINALFTKRQNCRGGYPIGVRLPKKSKKFISVCNDGRGKDILLGYFLTVEEAFDAYKIFKENLIKEIAEKYKDKIPEKLYLAMLSYKVEITD